MALLQVSDSTASERHGGFAPAARRKFLRLFPGGFSDPEYLDWERDYKWNAHRSWNALLGRTVYRTLLGKRAYREIARRAVAIESRTNLIFSFEKMALRDAVRPSHGARAFAQGLYKFVYGLGTTQRKFEAWSECVAALPRPGTRIHTWPVVSVFGFIADPKNHLFVKPMVTRKAAAICGFDFRYRPTPNWSTYRNALDFAVFVQRNLSDLRPRDMIDLQSFIWVQGSTEYD